MIEKKKIIRKKKSLLLPNTCCCCCYFCRRRLGAVWKYYSQLHRRAIIVSCAKKSNNFFCFFFFFNSRFMDYSVSWQFSVLPRLLRLLRGAVLLRDVEHRPIVSFSVLQSSYFIFFFFFFPAPLFAFPSVRPILPVVRLQHLVSNASEGSFSPDSPPCRTTSPTRKFSSRLDLQSIGFAYGIPDH